MIAHREAAHQPTAGVSRETVRKAEVIRNDADESTKQAVRTGERSTNSGQKRSGKLPDHSEGRGQAR